MTTEDKRVTVIMPEDMVRWLEEKARQTGAGNISAFLRIMIRNAMNEDASNAAP